MNRLFDYLRESQVELTKVNWPDRATTVRLTIMVIVFSAVVTAFIGSIDYFLSLVLQKVILKG